MANSCHICGLGSYVPDKILTNHDLEKLVDTSDGMDSVPNRYPAASYS